MNPVVMLLNLVFWLAFAAGLAVAHPSHRTVSREDKKAAFLDSFCFNTLYSYTMLDRNSDGSSSAGWKQDVDRDTPANDDRNGPVPYYVQAAALQVQKTVPNASFHVTDDYYIGTNNVGHVHFQQVVDGIDVNTAHFSINSSSKLRSQAASSMIQLNRSNHSVLDSGERHCAFLGTLFPPEL